MFCSKQITSKRVALRLDEADPDEQDEEEEEDEVGEEPLILRCVLLSLFCFLLLCFATAGDEMGLGGVAREEKQSGGKSTIWTVKRVAGAGRVRAERRCVRVALRLGCGMEDGR